MSDMRIGTISLTRTPPTTPLPPPALFFLLNAQLLFDFDFKREFTRVFIRVYEDFMKTILFLQEYKEIPTRMVDISVQLFSNSVLTVSMIREVVNSDARPQDDAHARNAGIVSRTSALTRQ